MGPLWGLSPQWPFVRKQLVWFEVSPQQADELCGAGRGSCGGGVFVHFGTKQGRLCANKKRRKKRKKRT